MTDEEFEVVECMGKMGGGFVQSLAEAFHHADASNFRKLRDAFPEYWAEFSGYVQKQKGAIHD